jgi:hypothetical protein
MKMKEVNSSDDFEEYLDDYLAHMACYDKSPRYYDRTLLIRASQWIGWLNDETMINRAYIRTLEKQVKELGGHTR